MNLAMRTDADTNLEDARDGTADETAAAMPANAMHAITLWQPWATLWASGLKQIETRGWSTPVRGRVLIHAALTWNSETIAACHSLPIRRALERLGHVDGGMRWLKPLTRGAIVGCAEIESIIPTVRSRHEITDDERAFGDYSAGRFAWVTLNQLTFDEPIRASGARKFWVPDAETLELCRAAIARAEEVAVGGGRS